MSKDLLIELFADELDLEETELSDESSPENIEEWDSLAAVRLVAAIETEFDVRLSTGDIMKMRSIGVARKVLQKKGIEV